MQKRPIYLTVSLDVEEEGLFRGVYERKNCTVENTRHLERLSPLIDQGVRPTLFCAYTVLSDSASLARLETLKAKGAEIAVHLHHWNTPPLPDDLSPLHSVPSKELTDDIFLAKLKSVIAKAKANFGPVTSFRMGRWDIHRRHFPLLAQAGIITDASVRPLHGCTKHNPDHFSAPAHPYWIPTSQGALFEVPLTVTPIVRSIVPLLNGAPQLFGACSAWLKSTTNYWGALALLPAYHPLWLMQTITSLYLLRGGRTLSLTWHSSEMCPGGAPHIKNERQVAALLRKVTAFIDWLSKKYALRCVTMNELRNIVGPTAKRRTAQSGDWTVDATQTP